MNEAKNASECPTCRAQRYHKWKFFEELSNTDDVQTRGSIICKLLALPLGSRLGMALMGLLCLDQDLEASNGGSPGSNDGELVGLLVGSILESVAIVNHSIPTKANLLRYCLDQHSKFPSTIPSNKPSALLSLELSIADSSSPSVDPTEEPSKMPSTSPTSLLSSLASSKPSSEQSDFPINGPSLLQHQQWLRSKTRSPSSQPSKFPTATPTSVPSTEQTFEPS